MQCLGWALLHFVWQGVVVAEPEDEAPARPGVAAAPWIVVILALAAAAFWLLTQPMDMRGVSFAG